MNILDHAIAVSHGVNLLAKKLGVKQNVVSNWRHRGRIPKGWETVLNIKFKNKKAKSPRLGER